MKIKISVRLRIKLKKFLLEDNLLKKIFVESMGFTIVRRTKKSKVRSLIEKLHPLRTDKELIRMGPNDDGGYLVSDDLMEIEACFSPGVDTISEFELDCLKRGMKIFLADRTVDKPNFNIEPDKYHFLKKHIGSVNNDGFITLDVWVNSFHPEEGDLLLQMDIEGAEYTALLNVSEALMKRFRIMVIEFHHLQDLWLPRFFDVAEAVFDKILETHVCVHIHPNNYYGIDARFGMEIPRLAEFTFLRKDRIDQWSYQTEFPHKLDFDNTDNPHIKLPDNWYKGNA